MATTLFPRQVADSQTLQDLINDSRAFELGQKRQIIIYPGTQLQVVLPPQYQMHMGSFLWRETVIRLILRFRNDLDIDKMLEDNLIMILEYMNNIFKRVCLEARGLEGTEEDFHSKTFDEYLVIEHCVRRHEPFEIRKFRRTRDTNLNWMTVEQCDWQKYWKEIDPLWSGYRNRFKLPKGTQNLKSVTSLFQHVKSWYTPYVIPDKYFGYTYHEHEGSSEEDSEKESAERGAEIDPESEDEAELVQRVTGASGSQKVKGASDRVSKTVNKGKKATLNQSKAKAKAKAKGKGKGKGKKTDVNGEEVRANGPDTRRSRVTRSSQKKQAISKEIITDSE